MAFFRNDSKSAWKVVKEVLNVEDSLSPTSVETINSKGDEIVVSNPLKIANEFNNYFTKKVGDIRGKVSKNKVKIPAEVRLQRWLEREGIDPPGFKLEEISASGFREAMKKFKPKKVHGGLDRWL